MLSPDALARLAADYRADLAARAASPRAAETRAELEALSAAFATASAKLDDRG